MDCPGILRRPYRASA